MFDLSNTGEVVAAIGSLGLASFALVDTSKVGRKGGVSNSGFSFIEGAVRQLLPDERLTSGRSKRGEPRSLLDILHGNWICGVALGDQKAIAKSLIKLRLSTATSRAYADATRVDAGVLSKVAEKMSNGESLEPNEVNVLGRFDLALTATLDEGYHRADQKYRNTARLYAMLVSLALAVLGGWAVAKVDAAQYFWQRDMWIAGLCGLLATPLAPISKDLTSALTAGVKLAQTLKK
jgi:hypothetical protein